MICSKGGWKVVRASWVKISAWRHDLADTVAHSLATKWRQESCQQICSRSSWWPSTTMKVWRHVVRRPESCQKNYNRPLSWPNMRRGPWRHMARKLPKNLQSAFVVAKYEEGAVEAHGNEVLVRKVSEGAFRRAADGLKRKMKMPIGRKKMETLAKHRKKAANKFKVGLHGG